MTGMRVPGGFSTARTRTSGGSWQIEEGDDAAEHIKGFASATSVPPEGVIDFHISVARAQGMTVEVWRISDNNGAGATFLGASEPLAGRTQPKAVTDPATGMITCPWSPSWRLRIPADWKPGAYLAVLRADDGHANHVPFAVRGLRRRADWLVVLPFATYQAYNMYPYDGVRGKNLYKGFDEFGDQLPALRASAVSFRRPYELTGMPREADRVHDFIVWAERQGYDLDYATSLDLHEGRVRPLNYRGLVFPGHDEYWSAPMRRALTKCLDSGVSAVFLQANNAYWHVRIDGPAVTCFKSRADPVRHRRPGQTVRWRDLRLPEQQLLGTQYVSVVKGEAPLVVSNAGHWFWSASGVEDGETIAGLVGGEADAVQAAYPEAVSAEAVILAESPYLDGDGAPQTQQTMLRRTRTGAWVFVGGTFNWPVALGRPGATDPRIQAATAALLARIAAGDGLAPRPVRRLRADLMALRRVVEPAAIMAVVKPFVRRAGGKVKRTLLSSR